MGIPAHLSTFWAEFAKHAGGVDEERFSEAFFFGDSEQMANDLARLVLHGAKRATSSALWAYEAQAQRLPQPRDLSVVTNWHGHPLCVIETQSVEIVPFRNVTAEFAAAEGEGDRSLFLWQREHWDFFSRECAAAGRTFSDCMLVVCARFDVLYAAPEANANEVLRPLAGCMSNAKRALP